MKGEASTPRCAKPAIRRLCRLSTLTSLLDSCGRARLHAVVRRSIYSISGVVGVSTRSELLSSVWCPRTAGGTFRILARQAERDMELWVSNVGASSYEIWD